MYNYPLSRMPLRQYLIRRFPSAALSSDREYHQSEVGVDSVIELFDLVSMLVEYYIEHPVSANSPAR